MDSVLLKEAWVQIPYKIAIALLLSVILLGIGIYSYVVTGRAINSKVSTYPTEVTGKISLDIKIEMTRFVNYSSQIIFSDAVQNGLPNYSKLDKSSKLETKKAIEAQFQNMFMTFDNFIGAEIITEEGEMIRYYVKPYFSFTYHEGDSEVVKSLRKITDGKNQLPMWSIQNFPTGKSKFSKYIILSRTIKSSITNEKLGFLVIALKEDRISSIYKNLSLGENSKIIIMDTNENQINNGDPWSSDAAVQIIKNIEDRDKNSESFFNYKIGDIKYSFIFFKLKDTNWYVVSSFPASIYGSGLHDISGYLIVAGIICLSLFLIIFIFTQNITTILKSKYDTNIQPVSANTPKSESEISIIKKEDNTPDIETDGAKEGSTNCRREVREAIKYIEENYAKDILIEFVAKEQYISTSHLMHLFKEELGTTFNEYLIKYRIDMSKCLLKASRYKIYEVSEKVGYRNVKYFSQTFKKIVGVTPREFIRYNS